MKVAVLSDIHGNWPALEAVLNDLPADCSVTCCGDFVGYYPYVNEVCDWAREAAIPAIRGNHDAMVLGIIEPSATERAACGIEWTRAHLSEQNLTWLGTLPVERHVELGQSRLTLRHASPWDETTYLFADSPRWSEIEIGVKETLVVAHTHWPSIRRVSGGLAINPGSVGQPRDYDPRPCYAMLDTDDASWSLRRVSYDYRKLQQKLERMQFAPELISILSRTQPA